MPRATDGASLAGRLCRRWVAAALVATLCLGSAVAALAAEPTPHELRAAPPAARPPTAAEPEASGKVLYDRFCASCHGTAGRGDGPVAASLKAIPTDLTTLAQSGGGKLDEAALMAVIDGRRAVGAHGPREMPVWGAIFDAQLEGQPFAQLTGLLRSRALADYIATLQRPGR